MWNKKRIRLNSPGKSPWESCDPKTFPKQRKIRRECIYVDNVGENFELQRKQNETVDGFVMNQWQEHNFLQRDVDQDKILEILNDLYDNIDNKLEESVDASLTKSYQPHNNSTPLGNPTTSIDLKKEIDFSKSTNEILIPPDSDKLDKTIELPPNIRNFLKSFNLPRDTVIVPIKPSQSSVTTPTSQEIIQKNNVTDEPPTSKMNVASSPIRKSNADVLNNNNRPTNEENLKYLNFDINESGDVVFEESDNVDQPTECACCVTQPLEDHGRNKVGVILKKNKNGYKSTLL